MRIAASSEAGLPRRGGFWYGDAMTARPFRIPALLLLAAASLSGCASRRPEAEEPVDPDNAFTPIQAKYSAVTPADLGETGPLRIAVVDVDLDGPSARLAFLPGSYRPANGICQLLSDREECPSVAALVKAIDRRVDRMPFGILFTYRGRLASDSAVARGLPAAYGDFYGEFQAAMKAEDIDYVLLVPEKVVFLR